MGHPKGTPLGSTGKRYIGGNGGLPDIPIDHRHRYLSADERGVRRCFDVFCPALVHVGTPAHDALDNQGYERKESR